jgi:hypothetical protein
MRPQLGLRLLGGSLLALAALTVHESGSQPTPENLCIQQVGDQYQALVKDQVMAGATDLAWAQQLTAIASQVRQHLTQYEIKRNQADLAEKNVAQLLEQLRQAQGTIAALRKDLEQAKGDATLAPAPRN